MAVATKKAKPINLESEFLVDELFFSTTDLIGNILSGNSVFVRVSQFTKEDLIGSPHNIIRHPEMPKLVFKVLWDYIKAEKTVVAYVKNMTREGRFYWVLACVFPIPGGYLSIRLKPTSEIFKLIPDIYKKLLEAEDNEGVEASLALLLKTIKSKGFDDYDAFMSTVLVEELNSRQRLLANTHAKSDFADFNQSAIKDPSQQHLFKALKDVGGLCRKVTESFNQLFNDFENLLKIETVLKDNSTAVLNFSEAISILSLNVNIKSYYAGETGKTLSVVAKAIKGKTEEIESFTQSIVRSAAEISTYTQKLGFQTSTPRLQSLMINYFIMEIYEQALKRKINAQEIQEMKSNILVLIELFTSTFAQLNSYLKPLSGKIDEILDSIELINGCIYELERSNFLGNIEAAQIGEQGEKFILTFNEIRTSTETTKQRLLEFKKYLFAVNQTTVTINEMNGKILQTVETIKGLVSQLKEK